MGNINIRPVRLTILTLIMAAFMAASGGGSVFSQEPVRKVEGNTLSSESLPRIMIEVSDAFKYLGSFDFKIRDVAKGRRFVFADIEKGKVQRLFIAQFEAFLPEVDDHYRYSFTTADTFGGHKFRQNTYAYSNAAAKEQNPLGEAVLTAEFIGALDLELEDELVMSRFLTVPDTEKKHELILYYLEKVSQTGRHLEDFYNGDDDTSVWKDISVALTARSLKAFKVL